VGNVVMRNEENQDAFARAGGPKVYTPVPNVQGYLAHKTWKREFKLPWREAGPPNHHDDKVDSDQ